MSRTSSHAVALVATLAPNDDGVVDEHRVEQFNTVLDRLGGDLKCGVACAGGPAARRSRCSTVGQAVTFRPSISAALVVLQSWIRAHRLRGG